MKKLYFPLKLKLILLFVMVVAITILIYLGISLKLFQADKSAYIFSTSLSQAEGTSKQLHLVLHHLEQQAWNFTLENETNLTNLEGVLGWSLYEFNTQGFYLSKEHYFQQLQTPKTPWPLPKLETLMRYKTEIIVNERVSRLTFFKKDENKALSIYLDKNKFMTDIGQSGPFMNVAITPNGDVFVGPSSERKYWKQIMAQDQKEIVKSYEEKYLAASVISKEFPLIFISEIPLYKAYAVVDEIQNKALWLAIFVISIGVIFGIIFSRKVTKPLSELAELTEKIGKGDFSQKAEIKSSDEVGLLAESFNLMSSELLHYIDEMKEKLRLEKEVQVAGLVQQCFFPPISPNQFVEVGPFFRPASECGGDWWGMIEEKNRAIFFMADATGHGVPAALLTATAHACKSSLELMVQSDQTYWSSPNKILQFFNHAVKQVGSDINMTMIVLILDFEKKKLHVANASHLPALFIAAKDVPQIDRSKINPLLTVPGPRLGQESSPTYEEFSQDIDKNDIILLTTDGLTEKMGQRKLIQSILKSAPLDPQDAVKSLMDDFDQHLTTQNLQQDDDVTLLWLRALV